MNYRLIGLVADAIIQGMRLDEMEVWGKVRSRVDAHFRVDVVAAHVVATIRESRIVRSPEALVALPDGAVIRDGGGFVGEVDTDDEDGERVVWAFGHLKPSPLSVRPLPVRILSLPDDEEEGPDDDPVDDCGCHFCDNEWRKQMYARYPDGHPDLQRAMMILCPQCGCKRCPRATHHDHLCTRSNEPGQPGSVDGDFKVDLAWMDAEFGDPEDQLREADIAAGVAARMERDRGRRHDLDEVIEELGGLRDE